MHLVNSLLKIPLLIAIIWANHLTYTPPNPRVAQPTGSSSAGYAIVNMRPPWARTASKFVVRGAVMIEIITIIANVLFSHVSETGPYAWASCPNVGITPMFAAGWLVLAVGALIRRACYREMGKNFTFEVTIRKDHRLVTSGPYSVVRHPSYTALSMVAVGSMVVFLGRGSWMGECGVLDHRIGQAFALVWIADAMYVPLVMVFARVKMEDEMLKKTFGREWEQWATRTPCALVPGIY